MLLGVRGQPKRIHKGLGQLIETVEEIPEYLMNLPNAVLQAAWQGRHSKKPDEVRKRIHQLMGVDSSLEMFARERVADWDAWGNDPAIGNPDVLLTLEDIRRTQCRSMESTTSQSLILDPFQNPALILQPSHADLSVVAAMG